MYRKSGGGGGLIFKKKKHGEPRGLAPEYHRVLLSNLALEQKSIFIRIKMSYFCSSEDS